MYDLEKPLPLEEKVIDVLTVGEVLVDMIDLEGSYHPFFGGSPANIAMNVKALGGRSALVAAVGKDRMGEFLKETIKQRGLTDGIIQENKASTSMVLVNKTTGTPIPIFYRGADYQLDYTNELKELASESKILHFSSWPISQEHSRKTIENLIEQAKAEGTLISFDPNYHPALWQEGHDGIDYIKELIKHVDIIKPSEDDAERIFGPDTVDNQIKKFLDLGAKLVVMTLGKDGLVVANGEQMVHRKTKATKVVDATGAGDAFWSGFYTGLCKGKTILEAVDDGSRTSAYKLQYVGAVVELPTLEELEDALNG